MSVRLVFMGSPDFAIPTLRAIHRSFQVVGVVTQPDRTAGRGRKITSPPIKLVALQLGIPFIQPIRLSQEEAITQLQDWAPDAIVVAAYGQILRENVLDLPAYGCINVHASLLPRWRGASPINHAILHGDSQTGITIMRMDRGLDTGPILAQAKVPINENDTAGSLSEKLAVKGAELLPRTLREYITGTIQPQPQDDELATYAPLLKKSDGKLDFSQPADQLVRKIKAFNPWPGTFFHFQGQMYKVHQASSLSPKNLSISLNPGESAVIQGYPALGTGDGILILEIIQPAGKKPMSGPVYLRGARGWE